MKIDKAYLDRLLDVSKELTLRNVCNAISEPIADDNSTYDFKMGLVIATYDTKAVLYDVDNKRVVMPVVPHNIEENRDMIAVDNILLLSPIQMAVLQFCTPAVASIMANPETLVTFNKPYLDAGVLHLPFVVYINSKEMAIFESCLNTKSLIFKENFTDNDFTEMDKESKLFLDSIQNNKK